MNKVVEILMKRDDLTKEEAKARLLEVREMINDAVDNGEWYEAEDIIADELGLEMDYIFDILY